MRGKEGRLVCERDRGSVTWGKQERVCQSDMSSKETKRETDRDRQGGRETGGSDRFLYHELCREHAWFIS